ncbi:PD-(D/E)XK nuclease family protein [Verrucosispora sp. WMMD1129]|uniref:ATP-dependent helicase n=1 Tax=Verrucosispora sp. WMMD1129 TaxID=3016093 RepID=UPI00249A0192|nr:PD-(D/E)XK nuclease family protein [Verrucosispora sp. WMMD1129]WFE46566.1 PD-(D/E)XK nuclease family protein [Verrucosispora sp. WMMD1129]
MQAYRLVRRPAGPTEGSGPSVEPPSDAAHPQAGQGQGVPDQAGQGQVRSGQAAPGHAASGQAEQGQAAPGQIDPRQAEVVAHTAGPMLVVGGPGTGKTRTLIEAVTARVTEGVDPERILVLTFSRRGAADLRHRVEARIAATGQRVLREPLVRTFPAYAFGLLRRAAAERGEPSPRLLTGPEQDLIIRELLDVVGAEPDAEADAEPGDDQVGWPADLRPALRTRAFAAQLRDLLMRAAERGVGPVELARLGERLGRADWPAAARFLRQYVAVLALRDVANRGSVAYDPAELVRAATGMLRDDPELLAAERRRLAHVYVDELADTDPAQLELLDTVAGGGLSLVAFADPDSSTYAFRGADPGGVTSFPHRFRTASGAPAAQVLLTTSYRAGERLLAATTRLGRRLRGPAAHRQLRPLPDTPPGTVEVRTFSSTTSEAAWLAHALREAHLLDGVPWARMAVLVRSTARQLPGLRRALHAAGVPTVVHGEDLPLHLQPAVAPLLLLLRCALEPERLDEEAAVALLHSPLGGADPLAERRLRQGLRALALARGDRRPSGELIIEVLRDPAELVGVERRWAEPAQTVAGLLAVAREAADRPAATAEEVLWAVWRASGLAELWSAALTRGPTVAGEGDLARRRRAEAADRDLDAVLVLFDAAARFTDRLPGARTEVFLDHVLGQELPADTLAPTADRGDAVRLLTAHAAKGLEWDLVAVAGVQEGVWPDLRLRGSLLGSERLVDVLAGRGDGAAALATVVGQTSALLDEERRLFHVAVSRARRRLLVSAVASASVGGDDHEEQPSRFLYELGPTDDPAGAGGPPPRPQPPDEPLPAGTPAEGIPDDDGPAGTTGEGHSAPARLPLSRPPRALTLPALVAELRTAVADPAAPLARRRAAAAELARLAAAGVSGAHPDDWWGLRPLSDDRPLVDDGEPVRVTPSGMESALRCSLRWLLERHGGSAPASTAQGVGNLVHAAAMLAEDARADRETLLEYVAARFDAIELAARWMVGPEQTRAEEMVDKLLRWLAANPRRLLAIEQEFAVRLDDPRRPVELTGRVDRLEIDADGRLVVVDLKTGKSTAVTEREVAEHPQLGAYQAAVEAGAFAEFGDEPGGAALVQLGTGAKDAREQAQPPTTDGPEAGWATALVRRTADTMAASTFAAVANSKCRVCPVRSSCPVSGQGRQVVEP